MALIVIDGIFLFCTVGPAVLVPHAVTIVRTKATSTISTVPINLRLMPLSEAISNSLLITLLPFHVSNYTQLDSLVMQVKRSKYSFLYIQYFKYTCFIFD